MSGASSGRYHLDDGDSAAGIEHVSARPRDFSQHVNDACPGHDHCVTRSEFDVVGRHFGGIFGDRQGIYPFLPAMADGDCIGGSFRDSPGQLQNIEQAVRA